MKTTTINRIAHIITCLIAPIFQLPCHMLSWVDDMIYEMRVAIRTAELFYQTQQVKARKEEKKERIKKKLLAEMEE
jgi:hypothetical protein